MTVKLELQILLPYEIIKVISKILFLPSNKICRAIIKLSFRLICHTNIPHYDVHVVI